MAKEDNLINLRDRSLEERKEIARMGGIRAAEVKRERATMRKTLELLLEQKNNKGKTYREMSTLGLIKGAVEGKAENYKIILSLLGELEEENAGTPNVSINIIDNSALEKIMYENEGKEE